MMGLRENLEQGRRWNDCEKRKLRDGNLAACKSHDARAMAVQAQSEVWALRRGDGEKWGGANETAQKRASDGKRESSERGVGAATWRGGVRRRREGRYGMIEVALALLVRRTAPDTTWGPRSEAQM